jgi:hypothetical protein
MTLRRILQAASAALVALSSRAGAAPPEQAPNFGIVDQLVSVAFPPKKAFVLVAPEGGALVQMPASVVRPTGHLAEELGTNRVLAGGVVPRDRSTGEVRFTFFLKGDEGRFAATPVRVWTRESLNRNIVDFERLASETARFERLWSERSKELEDAEAELEILRKRASEIASVEEIIDLKLELARLKGFGSSKAEEEGRLKELIERASRASSPPDIDERRGELSVHLQDAARASALQARLSRRKQAAARSSLAQKLALIKQMSSYDPQSLAQEVLKLRARRKSLERKANPSAPKEDSASDF